MTRRIDWLLAGSLAYIAAAIALGGLCGHLLTRATTPGEVALYTVTLVMNVVMAGLIAYLVARARTARR